MLQPILLYVLVTATINAFNVFTQVYVMTLGSQAAPGQAVRVLVFDIYQNAFQYFRMGYASAEAVTLTMIVLGFTLIQFRLVRSAQAQEAEQARSPSPAAARSGRAGPRHPDGRARCSWCCRCSGCSPTSFKPPAEIAVWPPHLLPTAPTWANYSGLFEAAPFAPLLRSTASASRLVATSSVVLTSLVAGAVFAKYRFPGRRALSR